MNQMDEIYEDVNLDSQFWWLMAILLAESQGGLGCHMTRECEHIT